MTGLNEHGGAAKLLVGIDLQSFKQYQAIGFDHEHHDVYISPTPGLFVQDRELANTLWHQNCEPSLKATKFYGDSLNLESFLLLPTSGKVK